ncbi:hypothetical protein BDV96DRAFT_366802 [Lophiotrema nucula]|uniref:Uncharacterized protein n=1 Tax=Lophiotrema nucula TaxID=690887 RepID=A0A6A5ZHE5_9PLEO|nr:hypothetical protein BDV96DRAFT_366802 [Lophiotrema nucula]
MCPLSHEAQYLISPADRASNTLSSIPTTMEQDTKLAIQTISFLDLPKEIRIMVYVFALRWPTFTKIPHGEKCEVKKKYFRIYNNMHSCQGEPMWPPYRILPPILRLCKLVHAEALEELCRTPLVYNEAPPEVHQGNDKGMDRVITDYLPAHLLLNVRTMELHIDFEKMVGGIPNGYQEWLRFLVYIDHVYSSGCNLESLTIRLPNLQFKDLEDTFWMSWDRKTTLQLCARIIERLWRKNCEIRIETEDERIEPWLREEASKETIPGWLENLTVTARQQICVQYAVDDFALNDILL